MKNKKQWEEDLLQACEIIRKTLWSDGFIDNSNNFERLRYALMEIEMIYDNIRRQNEK